MIGLCRLRTGALTESNPVASLAELLFPVKFNLGVRLNFFF